MPEIKAIIFDMDGVLIDAREWHFEALNRALALFGFTITRYEHLVTFDGLPTRIKLEMLTRERGLPKGLHRVINDLKQNYTLELVQQRCKPRFNHEYALSKLRAEGFKLGVASNSVRRSVETMMTLSQLDRYLDFMLSNEDVKAAKPDPEIYLSAVKRAGCEAAECLVVEDNENGLTSARAAGVHVMAVGGVEEVTYSNILKEVNRCAKL
jgi:beta-phosphoglucomutase